MSRSNLPLAVVPVSIFTYSVLFRQFVSRGSEHLSPLQIQARHRAFSACHASVATIAVLYALSNWTLRPSGLSTTQWFKKSAVAVDQHDGYLDDSENPLIQARSTLANAITAWETGYLIFDTWAMIKHAQQLGRPKTTLGSAVLEVAKKRPAIFGHHLVLSCSFSYLQYYIWKGRERGIWIIMAFLLMNGSNPLMHARWMARGQGRSLKATIDVAFAMVFALLRFGTVSWALKAYGDHHGLGGWDAYRKLRRSCQLGTGGLVGLNSLWWLMLMYGIAKRSSRGYR